MDNKLRLRFEKTGKAKYISHLDLMSTLERALIRAGIKLQYSQGFNPHPYLSIAIPLSVGTSSYCELVDFKTENYLLPDGLPLLINDKLPEDINILKAYIPFTKFSNIKWVKVNIRMKYDKVPDDITNRLTGRFSVKNIIINKKTKRGVNDLNITPYFKDICYNTHNGDVLLSVLLSAQEPVVSPQNLLSSLSGEYEELMPDFASFERMELYDVNFKVFK